MRFARPALARWFVLCTALLLPSAASAQATSSSASTGNGIGDWEPLGQLPVDQAGTGRRGYTLAAEDTDVTPPRTNRFFFHGVAANNLYDEERNDFRVSVRYETHTVALGYWRGFGHRDLPRFDFGGQIQLHRRSTGVLNGFIAGFEDFWVALTGNEGSKSSLREPGATLPPLGSVVARKGRPVYRDGLGSGFGDIYLLGRVILTGGAPSSAAPRVAVRAALNIAGQTRLSGGNFFGLGISADKKLVNRAAVHGDLRVTFPIDRTSASALPLRHAAVGFSVGPELGLTRNSSISVHYNGSATPFRPTGTKAFDAGYGDISLGFGYRVIAGRRSVVTQIYARENMMLPFLVRPNIDPDVSLGVKVSIR